MAWAALSNLSHSRLWEHFNNLATEITTAVTGAKPKFAGGEVSIAPAATNPPAGTVRIDQSFVVTRTTESAGGGLVVPFPTAFPNAVVGMVLSIITGGSQWSIYAPGWSKSQAYIIVMNNAGASVGNGVSVTVAVHAWGW